MDDIIILRFFRFVKSKYTKTYLHGKCQSLCDPKRQCEHKIQFKWDQFGGISMRQCPEQ